MLTFLTLIASAYLNLGRMGILEDLTIHLLPGGDISLRLSTICTGVIGIGIIQRFLTSLMIDISQNRDV